MKNPRLSESFHGLPIGRGGFGGRAPLAAGEGDAAFDNLAFENDTGVENDARRARHSPPTQQQQRLARGRSLTLQDGSGATVYQHQQMTAPKPGKILVVSLVCAITFSRPIFFRDLCS